MDEDFPCGVKGISLQIAETQHIPSRDDTKKTIPGYIVINCLKIKKSPSKQQEKNNTLHTRETVGKTADLTKSTAKSRTQGHDFFKVKKEKKLSIQNSTFKNKGKVIFR